jgi:pyruvate ferredoxin oxidoreductase alpha subunit
MLEDDEVRKFVGEYKSPYSLLDIKKPATFGPLDLQDYYFEHKRQQSEAMSKVPAKVKAVGEEFGRLSGRHYGLIENYKMDDAEVAVIGCGSTMGTSAVVVDELRERGVKAGLVKIRMFRPFPAKDIVDAVKGLKAVAVLDRAETFSNQGGPLFLETKAALYDTRIPVCDYIYGLGGRDIHSEHLHSVFADLQHVAAEGPAQMVNFLGLRE